MIDNCPVCQYSSTGLPTQHRCPECGLEYESDGVLFAEPRSGWWAVVIANALMGLTVVVHWAWHLGRPRHYFLVSPRTIRILGREEEPEVYSMLDVGNARWSFVNGDVLIERVDGSELTTIRKRFLAADFRAMKLAKTVRQLRAATVPAEV